MLPLSWRVKSPEPVPPIAKALTSDGVSPKIPHLSVGRSANLVKVPNSNRLSRDSWHGQRIGDALAVEIDDGVMDGLVEGGEVCEGLVGEVMGLKIAPDQLDFIEFGGVFRQPLDSEPVCASGERAFAGVDRTLVLDQHDRLGLSPGLPSKETVELLQMCDEIAAALVRALSRRRQLAGALNAG